MNEFINVPKDVIFHSFIDWYRHNVDSDIDSEIMVADRVVVRSKTHNAIGYIYVMYGEHYRIRKDLYEMFANA